MEITKQHIILWIKSHKKELLIAGISIAALIGVILGIKNQKVINDIWNSMFKVADKGNAVLSANNATTIPVVNALSNTTSNLVSAVPKVPHDVGSHIRNLPSGWNASTEKLSTAMVHGYDLKPGQTWVEAYRTGINVA